MNQAESTALITTLVCGLAAAFMHWAAALSRERKVPGKKMLGEMIATVVVGALIEKGLVIALHGSLDVVARGIAACVVGFSYGPTALLFAAKLGKNQYAPDAPDPEPLPTEPRPTEPARE